MADHYDVPSTGGWQPPVLVRAPNLGQPRFVDPRPGGELRIVVAVLRAGVDVRGALQGRLFLQPLSDTRRILQDASTVPRSLSELSPADCPRLVPLTIEETGDFLQSPWLWGRSPQAAIEYPYARWVSLRLPGALPSWVQPNMLFNLVHDFPEAGWWNTNFHAVCTRRSGWDDFAVLQISDTHISWRNDTIAGVLRPRFPGIDDRFINFNQNLRDFIAYANTQHRRAALDLVVLTGDIVDYICDNYSRRVGRKRGDDLGPEAAAPIDNFELFRDIVVAYPSHPGVIVGEELQVPLFTVPGNHDYRRNEYPLIHKLQIDLGAIDLSSLHPDPIREYSTFDLTEDEACAYEGGLPTLDDAVAASFVAYDPAPPTSYRALMNPDADYVVELGRHRLVGLDTGHDDGVVTGILDYLLRRGSGKMFIEGSPNSAGFSAAQIAFLQSCVDGTDGLLLVACHAPLVNMRLTPHHLLREAEHQRAFSQEEQAELAAFLFANRPEATELEEYGAYAPGAANLLFTGDPLSSAVLAGIGAFAKWLSGDPGKSPIDILRDDGWLLGGTRVMKVGGREPYLAWGVAAHRFAEFLAAIERRPGSGTTATLVLTGHTHRSIEYVVTHRGNGPELTRYYHDYYLDNTIHGRRPQDYWRSAALPDAAAVTDPTVLWHRKSPLLVQTMSLGPRPSGQQPDPRLAVPYGAAQVRAGRFALYDLEPGTYAVHFVADQGRCSAVGVFDAPGPQQACGKAGITLRLQARNGVMPPLTDQRYPATDFAKRDLDTGMDVSVDGWVRSHPGGAAPSGTVYVAKAPRPVGGALLVAVRGGAIAEMERVSLVQMRHAPETGCAVDQTAWTMFGIARP